MGVFKEKIKCSYCKLSKARTEFFRCKTRNTKVSPRCKECQKIADNARRVAYSIHKQCLNKYGSICNRCGFTDIRALQIDHVNGGGAKEIRSFRKQWRKYYRMVLADQTGKYQVLCANCNWIKKSENKEGVR